MSRFSIKCESELEFDIVDNKYTATIDNGERNIELEIVCDNEEDNNSFDMDYYGNDGMLVFRERCLLNVEIKPNKTQFNKILTIECKHRDDENVRITIEIVQEAQHFDISVSSLDVKLHSEITSGKKEGDNLFYEEVPINIDVQGGSERYRIIDISRYHYSNENILRMDFDNGFILTDNKDKIVLKNYGRPFSDSNDYYIITLQHFEARNKEVKIKVRYVDFSKEYLRTTALENGVITFNILKEMGTGYIRTISYSTDNGETWNDIQNFDNKPHAIEIEVAVSEGESILWKGDARQTGYYDNSEDDWVGSFFSSTARFNIDGNVMSLCYGDNFIGKDELENDGQFAYLFNYYWGGTQCEVINAENLALPATTLTQCCYISMFSGCTSLVTAPELPATTLADGCYSSMFDRCTSLVTAPELPATTLVNYCYESMFSNCTSLNYIKAMFTTTPSNTYTSNWVYGVAASGTFVKNSTATWDVVGDNGVPNGWIVKTADGQRITPSHIPSLVIPDKVLRPSELYMKWGNRIALHPELSLSETVEGTINEPNYYIKFDEDVSDYVIYGQPIETILTFKVREGVRNCDLMCKATSSASWCRVKLIEEYNENNRIVRKLIFTMANKPLGVRKSLISVSIIDKPQVYVNFTLTNKPS